MEVFLYCILPMAVIFGIALLVAIGKNAQLTQAKQAYEASLGKLKENPKDIALREQTLKLGRVYANIARNNKHTVFDEVALMNDINVVAGSDVEGKNVSIENAATEKSIEERLHKLQKLKEQGLITEEEFEQKRSDILSDI